MARPSSTDRLVRLLALPAWVAEHDGATLAEAAAHFGVPAETIEADVSTLWVSGLPGGMPGDLVDFSADAFEDGRLSLTLPLGLERPVRLSREEASSLLLSLRVLRGLLGADADASAALASCEEVLTGLLGGALTEESSAAPVDEEVLAVVREALTGRRRLHLSYVSATDTPSERDVDPVRLSSDGSHLWLRAWCLSAKGERTFRLDRVRSAALTGERATAHRVRRGSRTETEEAAGPETATLLLAPGGRWLAEQVPCDAVQQHEDGTARVTVTGRDRTWLVGPALSAGRHLLAVEPPGLAAEVARRAREALRAYGTEESDAAGTAGRGPRRGADDAAE